MHREHFERQIARLRTQWQQGYGEERMVRLWKIFEKISNEDFTTMVDMALDTMRSAPLTDDFLKLEQELMRRRSEERDFAGLCRTSSPIGVLSHAAEANKSADPDFVKACLQVVRDNAEGRLAGGNFIEACDCLDKLANTLNPQGRYKGKERSGGKDEW